MRCWSAHSSTPRAFLCRPLFNYNPDKWKFPPEPSFGNGVNFKELDVSIDVIHRVRARSTARPPQSAGAPPLPARVAVLRARVA